NFLYHRLAALGATSKVKRNVTLTYGLRYLREPGRSDSEFPALPQLNILVSSCSSVSTITFAKPLAMPGGSGSRAPGIVRVSMSTFGKAMQKPAEGSRHI